MAGYDLDRPVFIIGAARSGTTMLGELISKHPDVAFWLEPKYIWRYAKAHSEDDIRSADEADRRTKNYIRKKFFKFTERKSKKRFVEKTPSNVFRISFINEIFPEALFVYIERDGRPVCLSAEKKWCSRPDKTAIYRRLFSFEIPMRDLFHYTFAFIRDVLGRIIAPKQGYIWGPHFNGIQEYRNTHSVIESCAKQWLESVNAAETALDKLDESRVYRVRYEDLLASPQTELKALFGFMDLDITKIPERVFDSIRNEKNDYTEEEREKLNKILPTISAKLKELNYS